MYLKKSKSPLMTLRALLLITLITLLSSCGGGSSDEAVIPPEIITPPPVVTPPTVETGQFQVAGYDVMGLTFETTSQNGITDSAGMFNYQMGETVTFILGSIEFGSLSGQSLITPIDLFSGTNSASLPVQNMFRLLAVLDSDGIPQNGITIYQAIIDQAANFPTVDFNSTSFDQDVSSIIAAVIVINPSASGLPALFVPTIFNTVSTLAEIQSPFGDGIAITPSGSILISGGFDKQSILKITTQGNVSTFASGLSGPVGMGFDSQGNAYIANYSGNSISKITPQGTISNFASGLDGPAGLIVSDNDEIFVTLFGADFSGTGATVLKFDTDGNRSTLATGNGMSDLIGITIDEGGVLYVTNWQSGHIFSISDGVVTRIGSASGNVNQIIYSNGYVYLPTANIIKRASVFFGSNIGEVNTFSGTGASISTDGTLDSASFNAPINITVSQNGNNLFVLDKGGKLRQISTN